MASKIVIPSLTRAVEHLRDEYRTCYKALYKCVGYFTYFSLVIVGEEGVAESN